MMRVPPRRSGYSPVMPRRMFVFDPPERFGVLLDELEARGITTPTESGPDADDQPLDEPINETFRATMLTLGWDGDTERILVEARAEDDEEEVADDAVEDDPEEGDEPAI